jgi:uncharacterized Tic20 family protein
MSDSASTPPPATVPPGDSQIRMWHMWAHLSALGGLLVPFGHVLGPLLVWQIKKNEIPSVEPHGKAALNFQLTVLIVEVALAIVGFALSAICIGFLFLVLIPVVHIASIVFAIIAALKANEGQDYRYPYSWELVK